MAKATWNEYDSTASNNTVVDDIDISEGCAPSTINNALRELMAHTADVVAGTTAINRLIVDNIDINGTTIGHTGDTDLLTLTSGNLAVAGDVSVTGTVEPAGDTAAGDSAAFGYTAALGAIITGQGSTNDVTLVNDADGTVLGIPTGTTNVEIAGGLTLGTDLSVANGGTGAGTHTANSVLIGAGTSAITSIAPGADGQVLTSTGSVWQSEAAGGGGKILQVVQHQFTTMVLYSSVGSWTNTAVTGAITPSSASSKILVMVDANFGASNYGFMRMRRGSTVIAVGTDSSGTQLAVSSGGMVVGSNNFAAATKQTVTWLDSPSTTSSTTYTVQVIDDYSANHVRLNSGYDDSVSEHVGRSASTLTLWEIDGS